MAVAATSIFEVQNGGSDSANSGGFDPGNANFPTDGAVTSATGATPVISSASYTFVSGDIGAWVFIKSGTSSIPMWAQITAVNGGAATLDCAIGKCPLYVGGTALGRNTAIGCGSSATLSSITFGVDYSQQTSARTTLTAATAAGAGSTITDSAIGKNWVGNSIRLTGGTNVTTGVFFVSSTSSTTATLDRAVTTGATSDAAGGMGGAVATPAILGTVAVTGNSIFQKGTVTVTVNTNNVAGGKFVPTATQFRYEGYGTTRGDESRQTYTVSGSITGAIFNGGASATSCMVRNIHFNVNGINVTVTIENSRKCEFSGWPNAPTGHSLTNIYDCIFNAACNGGGGGLVSACLKVVRSTFKNTGTEKLLVLNGRSGGAFNCNFWSASASILEGLQSSETNIQVVNCNFYKCRYNATASGRVIWVQNCLFVGVTSGNAISNGGSMPHLNFVKNCGFYNNATNYLATAYSGSGDVLLSGSPWVDPDNGNFQLNNTSGAGAACRATALAGVADPATISGLGATTNYEDLGAYQSAPGGGVSRGAVVNK